MLERACLRIAVQLVLVLVHRNFQVYEVLLDRYQRTVLLVVMMLLLTSYDGLSFLQLLLSGPTVCTVRRGHSSRQRCKGLGHSFIREGHQVERT